ncbi:acyl-CoA dehydrogenase family protein [Frankia sp. CNm7]|uniref:Acyl-CoA dehydrogenase family protein n=1 Tax=Frankia nepalensis TaxID=1836974 RepID=A0A937UR64_9ACTN|nr:acyl-CoA dehydrogenase family protein [Frankia nepalensis]MBL7496682.1 acyl-CoA dehydrogenase family protein [Frankia nepalensis]MBL7510676.1 acyl-CoA dehydrogenase family protein [Frankia nepalensis]MBL7516691.1 acyl-CoA dehydrogenase family protein [Frankia nepalensis]MBL7627421.1 acyl-CoA dehydrogenase family protein [Frankia nepalensis]
MDFAPSPKAADYLARLTEFMDEYVYPAEPVYEAYRRERGGADNTLPPVVEELKVEARKRGLWNLFLPDAVDPAHGLSVVDYAQLAEIAGRSPELGPEALNCSAPDTGNMEVLHLFGTVEQKERWLAPLLDGRIRSAFAMTEPDVASSDATNIQTSIRRDGDEYVINGRKWWISGVADPRCEVMIVMGRTDPDAAPHRQQSQVLVPLDTPGVEVVRPLPVFGYWDQHGHCEITFTDVRVPVRNLIAGEGDGFMIAQARLGPGRIHHCMRCIGVAERALEMACRRASSRVAFGGPLAEQGVVQQQVAESRMEIEQARLLTLKTAWLIDNVGVKGARTEIAAIKVIAPRVALAVLDRAIQIHGGGGVSDDFPLASMYAHTRTLRLADGPDEVHVRTVARQELRPYLSRV